MRCTTDSRPDLVIQIVLKKTTNIAIEVNNYPPTDKHKFFVAQLNTVR